MLPAPSLGRLFCGAWFHFLPIGTSVECLGCKLASSGYCDYLVISPFVLPWVPGLCPSMFPVRAEFGLIADCDFCDSCEVVDHRATCQRHNSFSTAHSPSLETPASGDLTPRFPRLVSHTLLVGLI